ncbi:MAG: XdhC family protein, partial [bacterium]
VGMGCPGNVRALLEPFDDEDLDLFGRLEDPLEEGVLATLFALSDGQTWRPPSPTERWRGLLTPGDPGGGASPEGGPGARLREAAGSVTSRSEASPVEVEAEGSRLRVLLEHVRPHPRLLIHGAGPGSSVLASLGRMMGWKVTVADHRPDRLQPAAFPGVELVRCHDVSEGAPVLEYPERTAVVVMTHHCERDRELLERYLPDSPFYVGLMSSRSRRDDLLDQLSPEVRERAAGALHSPMGLDLGADRPEEMALATAAEIQAALRDAPGGKLRDREGPVHRREETQETIQGKGTHA